MWNLRFVIDTIANHVVIFMLILVFRARCGPQGDLTRSEHSEDVLSRLDDFLRTRRVQACDGERVLLKCPSHTQVAVQTAFYGRVVPSRELCPSYGRPASHSTVLGERSNVAQEDTACDVTSAYTHLKDRCQNRRKCKVHVRSDFFGNDPCPSTSKYLQVSYKCKPSQFTNEYFCEGNLMELSCRPRKKLAIYSAIYGRTVENQATTCLSNVSVSKDCTTDVLSILIEKCHAQSRCSILLGDGAFQNVCPDDVEKYLSLIFMCVNENVFKQDKGSDKSAVVYSSTGTSTSSEGSLDQTSVVGPMDQSPSSIPKDVPPNNDAAYDPMLFTTSTEASRLGKLEISTCYPESVPNALGILQNWLQTLLFIKENKEKVILYFCLSSSVGIIILLIFFVWQQCQKAGTTQNEDKTGSRASSRYEANVGKRTATGSPTADGDSRLDIDFGHDGQSFMHFSHPTPPRVQTMHHYYYS